MQDSLEDYVRIAGSRKTDQTQTIADISKETLASITRQKQCENYAQKIVEFMIDGKLRSQIFLKSLNFITPEHYQDVVEERSVTKLCGYPLCGKRLSDMPNKQFHISTKLNKVFDITERKNFCSNYCYKASDFIKAQLDSGPLWMRVSKERPQIKLLDTSEVVTPGIEVNHGIAEAPKETAFTSINCFTEACLIEAEEMEAVSVPDDTALIEIKVQDNLKTATVADKYSKTKGTDENNSPHGILKKDRMNETNYDLIHNDTANSLDDETNSSQNTDTHLDTQNKNNGKAVKKKVQFKSENSIVEYSEPSSSVTNDDLHDTIQQLCRSMNIKLNTEAGTSSNNSNVIEDTPVVIDEAKMNRVIKKVNNTQRERKPIMIDTLVNPEKSTHKEVILSDNSRKEIPKYVDRILDKTKVRNEDKNVIEVIEKVKSMNLKSNKNDKMKEVLEKIKNKDRGVKAAIFVQTEENPEMRVITTPIKNIASTNKSVDKNNSQVYAIVKNAFESWLTLELYMFVLGEDKVKFILTENKLENYFNDLKVAELQTSQQIRYMEICKRLQLKELAESKFDCSILGKDSKPLPDYSQLKLQGKEMDLKVKAYYSGSQYEQEDKNFPQTSLEANPAVLPFGDVSSQKAIRRKVYINSITSFMQNHITELQLDNYVMTEVQSLIKTFNLDAKNIVFKPAAWNIIAYLLISVLSLKDEELKRRLEAPENINYCSEIFNKQSEGEQLLKWVMSIITNVGGFVETYIKTKDSSK